ncbi:MAG: cobyric acid synthase CobQ, partial [Chloroflexi bacterium]|nr:cobyric acid synthase CobQ [Chloroflexota bacterium]
TGYEIHMGQTVSDSKSPFQIEERSRKPCQELDGCQNANGNVFGTYVHGLFHNHELRRAILANLANRKSVRLDFKGDVWSKEEHYDRLADLVRNSLDMNLIYQIIDHNGK